MKKYLLILVAILIHCTMLAQIPQTISWQGIIQDADGNNLNGEYSIAVSLYDVATGGAALWTETHSNLTITNGLANITLGSVTPFSVTFDTQYWLEITVGSGTPMPRIQLTSVPYALHSATIAENSVNSNKIEDGSISAIDLSQMGASNGQILEWNGAAWVPATPNDFILPYYDTLGLQSNIFSLTNTVDRAILGVGPQGDLGYLGDISAGVLGKNGTSGNSGYLGMLNYSVYGEVLSNNVQDCGVKGQNTWAGTYGTMASYNSGVYGFGPGGNQGFLGSKDYGVFGMASTDTNEAVYGKSFTNDNFGYLAGGNYGVYGEVAVDTNQAVYGKNISSDNFGYLGGGNYGVYGLVQADSNKAVYGRNDTKVTYGYIGGESGVVGISDSTYGFYKGELGTYMAGIKAQYSDGNNNIDVSIANSLAAISAFDNNNNSAYLLNNGNYAVRGDLNKAAPYCYAVFGNNTVSLTQGSLGADRYGVYGVAQNDTTIAVYGRGFNSKYGYLGGNNYGMFASSGSTFGYIGSDSVAIYGKDNGGNYAYLASDNYAVYGNASFMYDTAGVFINSWKDNIAILSSPDIAVYGRNYLGCSGHIGGSYGAYGENSNGNFAYLGGETISVYGENSNGNKGNIASSNYGAYGEHNTGNFGYLGSISNGVFGENSNGNFGYLAGTYGAYGEVQGGNVSGVRGKHIANNNIGYLGDVAFGAYGENGNGNNGYLGSSSLGAYGENNNGNKGYFGSSAYGAYGEFNTGTKGYLGSTSFGVYGEVPSGNRNGVFGKHIAGNNYGYLGGASCGVYANNSNGTEAYLADNDYAGNFKGNVYILGQLGVNYTNPTYAIHLPNSVFASEGTGLATAWVTYSDSRLKMNQRDIEYGIKTIMQLAAKRYDHHSGTFEDGSLKLLPQSKNTIGLIAQEVFEIVPEAVTKPENENQSTWGMDYTKLIPVLIKGMQEQQEIINKQQVEIDELKEKFEQLMTKFSEINK